VRHGRAPLAAFSVLPPLPLSLMCPHDQIASGDCDGGFRVRWNVDKKGLEFSVLLSYEIGSMPMVAILGYEELRSQKVSTGQSVGQDKAKRGLLWSRQLRSIGIERKTNLNNVVDGHSLQLDRSLPVGRQWN
jgi:hypothetical protein